MNYESMSDFEVNKAVSMVVDFGGLVCFANDEREVVYICEVDGAYFMNPVDDFNPCNNLADAWPIMLENGIAPLAENGRIYGATTDTYEYYESRGNVIYSCEDKNPLRAAMIVFLMMSES